ncbi:GntR family transcriptional regulator [Microbacterium sp. SORGH_AS 1204]|uniref:GntR family transcriptional regulator n=1 Tax=Microbacterium sp. SORGH_AS_1204 TaxID=3041785 RepID=UPI00278D804F|nr:GntR family transcriptional regulator [Microbacterium sp. SORGH_AS_1204]MDQ1135319.1 GntR family transcriptional regulator [Microbacterium sp. SORGH_AS_1204]
MTADRTFATICRLADDLEARGFAKLPPERQLAERLNTSRSSVRRALERLEGDGRIRRVRGRSGGAFLRMVESTPDATMEDDAVDGATRLVERPLETVVGLPQMLRAQGFESGTRVISASFEHPSDVERAYFDISASDLVAAVLRLRFADGDTLSLESFRVPAARFPGLLESRLSESMYELLEQKYGVHPAHAHEHIHVTTASPRTAASLGIAVGAPLLKVVRFAEDQNGRPFERSIDLFRADRTVLSVTAHQVGWDPSHM